MARKARTAVAPSTDGLVIAGGEPIGRETFQREFDALLRRMEPVSPYTKARDIAERMRTGEGKVNEALAKGMPSDDPRLVKASLLLDVLKVQLTDIQRTWIIPHSIMHWIWLIVNGSEVADWPITEAGTVSVTLPGILRISARVEPEPPF